MKSIQIIYQQFLFYYDKFYIETVDKVFINNKSKTKSLPFFF